jgi:thiol:disulfide interchange protein DsbD
MRMSISRLPWLQLLAALMLLCGAARSVHAEDDFLDPEVAFRLSARAADERSVEVTFSIAPGYYLYREQFRFAAEGATLGVPSLPPGTTKFDETFQKTVEIHRGVARIGVPVQAAAGKFQLLVTNQGCADKGLCYPPQQRAIEVALTGFGGDGSTRVIGPREDRVGTAAAATPAPGPGAQAETESAGLDRVLRARQWLPIVGVFLLAGLLLSFTPCMLPMLPILSTIIVGHGATVSRGRGFALALSYSLGMALVYTALGIGAGLAGEGLAARLQQPWVLVLFALALVALALSMFGVYELQLPAALSGRLEQTSRRLPAGRFAGVFAMGGISALIVSPCVAAPLAGALVYLSQTRDVWLGGTALFSLAAGMSVPLLLVGASAGALLPRAGGWMEEIKRLFGLLLLGVALWTVQPVLPAVLVLALWGALALAAAVLLVSRETHRRAGHPSGWTKSLWRRSLAAVLAVCGLLQFVGAASGGSDPLQPLAHLRADARPTAPQGPAFAAVRSSSELDAALNSAGRPVMLDFYADWCVSCKEMERFTFVDPAVQRRLAGALLLRADVTANNENDRALLKRFRLFGPPGMIFFDAQGQEVVRARVAGFQDSSRFLETLGIAGL